MKLLELQSATSICVAKRDDKGADRGLPVVANHHARFDLPIVLT